MKKRCTNSACRRMFDTRKMTDGSCPHCGKTYPRLGKSALRSCSDRKLNAIMKSYLSALYAAGKK